MSRRRPAPRAASAAPRLLPSSPCPCGLSASYGDCCGRMHRGAAEAGTAEALMRSRFSAFVVQDEAYLLRSWHPDTRPDAVDFDPALHWTRLEVDATTEGGAFHSEGTVAFRAYWTEGREEGVLKENSRFVRHEGAWVYLDALSLG
ncbi:YchJ family metal-binding protein [Streptomyces sp. SP17BM10]|uniref:YchJ family protein n=1 Tax=Streptomyces sp. SP17BM10 TaxID=3002530 RepID=UPI002E78D496|nr:YchJ family metal-binding protein [Streptomyces sp. SP17BM10]MEE1783853.1 YchJ family metal-binding protein [Streptomyces sp. SP17BM10]